MSRDFEELYTQVRDRVAEAVSMLRGHLAKLGYNTSLRHEAGVTVLQGVREEREGRFATYSVITLSFWMDLRRRRVYAQARASRIRTLASLECEMDAREYSFRALDPEALYNDLVEDIVALRSGGGVCARSARLIPRGGITL